MGPEGNAFFGDLTHLAQAEDLETAAVGQDSLFPVHEFMKSPGFLDQVVARPQEQVIRIAENDLSAHIVKFFRRQRLDRRLRADRHEHGRLEGAVRRAQNPGAGAVTFGLLFVGNDHRFSSLSE